MPVAAVNGTELIYEDLGLKTGIPLVFIHGWTADMHRWDRQVNFFSAYRRVIRYNLRGHADNKDDADEYTIDLLTADLHSLLQTLKIEKAVFIGHSLGGMIAIQFALDHPEMTEQIILVGSVGKMFFSTPRKLLITISRVLPFRLFVKLNIVRGFKKGYPKNALDRFVAGSQRVPKRVVMSCFAAMCKWDVTGRLPSLSVKTHVIHGRYDIQFPLSEGEKLAGNIPNATLTILDCGHELPLERPADLNTAISQALQHIAPAGGEYHE